MATAHTTFITPPPKPQKPVSAIVLTLSLNEAETLAIILGRIGGEPTTTRRRYANDIARSLREARIDIYDIVKQNDYSSPDNFFQHGNALYFTKETPPKNKDWP